MQRFRKSFRQLPDPRAGNARHDLLEVLFVALAAVVCGSGQCAEMEEFGRSKEGLLRLFLGLEHGIPSHDTFSRVFRLLKPEAFELAFRRFMATFAKANGLKLTGVVAVDGKALRGAHERGGRATPLHLVNVLAVEARKALAQQKRPWPSAFPASPPWAGSPRGEASAASAPTRRLCAITSCPNTSRPSDCSTSRAVIGHREPAPLGARRPFR